MVYLMTTAILVALLGMVPSGYGLYKDNSKKYLILCGTLITFVIGMRLPGGDTYRYTEFFYNIRYVEDFGVYAERYEENNILFSEIGFDYCVWLLTRIFSNGQILVFVSTAFITYAACRFIYKNSIDQPLALLIYVGLGMMSFNMNGMRQAVAISICLFAYEYAKKGSLLKFLLTVLLAMLFHKTAICFLPVFVFQALKNSKINWIVYIGGVLVFLLFLDSFVLAYNDLTGQEYDTQNSFESGGITVVMLYAIGILLTVVRPRALQNEQVRVAFFGTVTGLVVYLTRYFSSQIMERVSYYYFYFLILLIPEAIGELKPDEQKIVRTLFIIAAVALFAYRLYTGTGKNFSLFFV